MTIPCNGQIRIGDDRWGEFVDHCELADRHLGPHRSRRTACVPPAWLVWYDDPPGDDAGWWASFAEGAPAAVGGRDIR